MGMSKYDRLLYILNLLRSRKNLNARMLAEECGVTERSIYRDILALSEANIPIYYDRGYKLASDLFLPPLNFDMDEYNCLRLALESTPLAKTDKYAKLVKQIRAKVDAGLSESVKQQKKFTPLTTYINITTTFDDEYDNGHEIYGVIEDAISSWKCLEIEYDSIKSGITRRVVEPYFIIFRGKAFYFVAYCRLRKEFRTFRLDRIVDLKKTEESFNPREDIKPESYFEGSWEVFNGEPVDVIVQFTGAAAKVILSNTHHPDELVEVTDEGKVIYRITTRGLEEIQRWILGFGGEAEVLEPAELRDNFRAIGEKFILMYNTEKY